ncbi:MAG: Arginine-tRNA ligase [Candidatus Gottesmanbacteria bacterium GW2011_GWA1_48_13]|uniref:Arginine--tRNA ligase n=1 Tax=Candidatus Gottesmanbacteria bacterium GW2011_GWA1_48_13 TaxID=1618439 RepID=A0A0G1XL42_9BACT|nr:MAG: Arginine-tRNA ligase [Candidatus Gottesmanbacteria bacterium GW2011_GWA1_48_13]
MQIKDQLKQIVGMKLEHPENEDWGDYAVFAGAKAGELIEKIKQSEVNERIEKMEVVQGFLNIRLKNQTYITLMQGVTVEFKRQKRRILVEYSSPNIAKSFGIGHLRSTIIGQALYNIYKFLGNEVVGDNHLGDWGTQFGKLLYMLDREKQSPQEKSMTVSDLEKLYIQYHKLSEDNKSLDNEAREWFKKLEEGDSVARKLWENCVQISLREFERIYKLLDINIDNSFGESYYESKMVAVINEAKKKGIAKESQGAWVIETGHGSPLMLLKSDGATTYATRDLATLKFRREKWDPDMIIYEVGVEQALHFQQVFEAAKMLGYVREGCTLIHTKHGLYLGPDGKKFRTRTGDTVNLEEVLQEAVSRAKKLGSENDEAARAVGIGAIKYFDLSHNVQSDIIFDWEKVMALDGNSGPYIQYTFARTCSVLAKAQSAKRKAQSYELNAEELAVLRWLYRWPEVVEEAGERLAPNLICNFIYELAQRFNSFYAKHTIMDNEFRLALTQAVGQVLKMGLEMLGIEALERM